MQKRKYQRPSMQIVEMKQQGFLLSNSIEATRNGYGVAQETEWE